MTKPMQPFNLGNIIAQAEGIKGQRLNNQINRTKLGQLMNPGPTDIGVNDISLKDFTAPSVATFRKTGDFNDLKRFTAPKSAIRIDAGDAWELYNPINQELLKRIPKELSPDKDPTYLREAAEARETGKQEAEFIWGPKVAEAVSMARQRAEGAGEAFTDLARMKASLPGLKQVTKNLGQLANTATYTIFGQGFDWAAKQLGFGATQGATDRAKFTAIVDNQVLPLLRQTFGAAFTAAEGDRLRATLGDANLSPDEKRAQLDAFVEQKVRDIEAKQSEIDMMSSQPSMSDSEYEARKKRLGL